MSTEIEVSINDDGEPLRVDGSIEEPLPPESERVTVVRAFTAPLEAVGDGRTLEGICVPYSTPAVVADPPDYRPYREEWLAGAFDRNMRAAHRVLLDFEHEPGIAGVIGRALELESTGDGLLARFKVYDNAHGDKALQMYHDGVLTSLSVSALALKSRQAGDVTQRVKAHLDRVALCRQGAYEQAKVLAVRAKPVVAEAVTLSPAVDGLLAGLGVEPIARIKVVSGAWDGSPSRFTDEEYQRSCLVDRGGDAPVKERCSLPVLEPDGAVNVNALSAAAAALQGARSSMMGVSREMKVAAARKLLRYYRAADTTPPDGVRRLATG